VYLPDRHILKVGIPYRTTDTRKEWEERAEMTIRKTSKPCIGGATPKRDRADLATDNRSVHSFPEQH